MSRTPIAIRVLIASASVLACLAMTASAQASSLRATGHGFHYGADRGETNDLTITATRRTVTIADSGAIADRGFLKGLPRECEMLSADVGLSVRCNASGWYTLNIDLGDGDDHILGDTLPRRISLMVDSGAGDDVIEPGSGNDYIVGRSGDDTLYGGPGNDYVDGGPGYDYVRGNSGNDVLVGGADFDFIFADGGNDDVSGGGDLDYMFGGGGNDTMDGGAGSDLLRGGGGNDDLNGGGGDDEIFGGKGRDAMNGGPGDDLIRARDGESDTIQCGSGYDEARIDAGEIDQARRSCELIKQADASAPDPDDDDELEFDDEDDVDARAAASSAKFAGPPPMAQHGNGTWNAAYDQYFMLAGN